MHVLTAELESAEPNSAQSQTSIPPSIDPQGFSHAWTRAEVDRLMMPEPLAKDLVKLFKLLSDETRLNILYFLTQRHELHVRALCDLLGESQPAVSHHLALLRVAGLIERRREGKHNFYALQTSRCSALLDLLFANMPEGKRRLRLDDYVLAHAPV